MIELPRFTISPAARFRWNRPRTPSFTPRGIKNQVMRGLPIFLFRAQGCSRCFAYSLDVTGRNIPPLSEHTKWLYVGLVAAVQLEAHPDTLRQLRTVGYYVCKE